MGRLKSRSAVKKQGARSKVKRKTVSAKALNRKRGSRPASFHMIRKVRSKKVHKQTGIENTVEKWLIDASADYKSEHPISRTHVDFFLPSPSTKGTIVEVQGCFWHGCARCYEKKTLTKTQMRARRKDGRRFTFFRRAGYNLVLVWEHEIEGDPEKARQKVLKYAVRTPNR